MHLVRKLFADRQAATAVEYGLIVAIMAAALIGGYGAFTGALGDVLSTIEKEITAAGD
ncbi:Flp family type IVb pilin [Rhizobium cremeum]|uniref:Flp family type IVb pilin n=1 Tax=Rhizobium cremeum TaxID=2813827 RepID=UPI000DDB5A14|nr:Flp family type IVb pilin [Rhizobium cremeum]MCJ7994245.1 Flp family type IVb pilin [Rhizobium cremeum]MCJ7999744.1 Flp family type IVb pilin [Rhizobium cremeum]